MRIRRTQTSPSAEPDPAEATEPDTASSPPDDLAAAAAGLREQADQHRARAAEIRATADRALAEARTQAAALIADAEREHQAARRPAADADREAERLTERAQFLEHAAALGERAADAGERADRLQAEHDSLTADLAAIDATLAGHEHTRTEIAAQITAAADAGDLDALVTLRGRRSALDDIVTAAQARRARAAARLDALGEPDGRGELRHALDAEREFAAEQRAILNRLFPDRPEAILDDAITTLRVQAAAVARQQQ